MEANNSSQTNNEPRFRDTEHGRLYAPVSNGAATVIYIGLFIGAFVLALLSNELLLGLPEGSVFLLLFSLMLVFCSGYATWHASIATLGTRGILWPALKRLLGLLMRGEKPSQISGVLPDEAELDRLAVQFQKGAKAFSKAGWIYGLLAAAVSLLAESALGTWPCFGVILALHLGWGYGLTYLGRRGFLAISEEP